MIRRIKLSDSVTTWKHCLRQGLPPTARLVALVLFTVGGTRSRGELKLLCSVSSGALYRSVGELLAKGVVEYVDAR